MVRTGAQAVAAAKRASTYRPHGMCQQFTRTCFNIGGGFGSARAAWSGARKRHYVSRGAQVPAGVPVYWLGGSSGYGHTAVSLGNGLVRSTDWPFRYNIGTARIDDISRTWHLKLVGWAEDINGTSIPGADTRKHDSRPDIHLDKVLFAVKEKKPLFHGKLLKGAVAKEVGKGKMNLASPILGTQFQIQYAKVQREYLKANHLPVTQVDADGKPGRNSLSWLGKRQGFDVV